MGNKHGCQGQLSIYDIDPSAMDMERYLYMMVDNTKYELPLCVCDSVEELSDITNVSVSDINDLIQKAEKRGGSSRFIKVRI